MPTDISTAAILIQDAIGELAKLTPLEYEQVRTEKAAALGLRTAILDSEVEKLRPKSSNGESDHGAAIILKEPEPWISLVDGAELLNALRAVFNRYVVLPAGAAVALALFVIHTFALEAADASPVMAISSPEKRCGKTIVLEILQALTYRPLPASNITAAALFRTIEAFKPTLLIDEADSFLRDNEELRGVLNSGHRRPTAIIIRTTGENFAPKTFSTWCAKAIALIGKLPPTLEDRSIVIVMRRKSRNESVERVRHIVLSRQTADLQRQVARWAKDNIGSLRNADPILPETLNDRAGDCWRPLFAIADRAGKDWPQLAREAALSLALKDGDSSSATQLLSDIRDIFHEQQADRLRSETIIDELVKLENRPWPDWKNGKPISKTQLARKLSTFDIIVKPVRFPDGVAKGYTLDQCADVFARYLDFQSVTPLQPAPDVECNAIPNRNSNSDVTLSNPLQPALGLICNDVTLSNPQTGEEEAI